MSADVLAALVVAMKGDTLIDTLTSGRVYYAALPPEDVDDMPRKAIVLTRSGNAGGEGNNSYVRISRTRIDVRCYGETAYDAAKLHIATRDFLKAFRAKDVGLADGSVHVYNTTVSGGPIDMVDPEAGWCSVWASYGVLASEIEAAMPPVVAGDVVIV